MGIEQRAGEYNSIEIDPNLTAFEFRAVRESWGRIAIYLNVGETNVGATRINFRDAFPDALKSIPEGEYRYNFYEKSQKPETNLDRWLANHHWIFGSFNSGLITLSARRRWDNEAVAIVKGHKYSEVCDELEKIIGMEEVLGMGEPTFDEKGETVKPETVHLIIP